MNSEILNQQAMLMILHAGNSRNHIFEALTAIEKGDNEAFDLKMKEAKKEITLAHSEQTKVLQQTIEESPELTILFTHAQDTLMTIMSELNMAKYLGKLFKRINENEVSK